MKSYMWGSGLLRITLVCPLYQDSVLRAACYGQNAVLQPYDLPVTRGGGKSAKPCKVKQWAKKDSNLRRRSQQIYNLSSLTA